MGRSMTIMLKLDIEPFNATFPRPTRSSYIGNGVQFLNHHLSSIMFRNKDSLEPLLDFLLQHTYKAYAFLCIGDLIAGHLRNLDAIASKVLGEQPYEEPALNSVLRIILQTSSIQEFLAADYILSAFVSMLLCGLTMSENDGDLETCCRAASVLSYVLKDNIQCKEKVLRIELEGPMLSLGALEPLLHRTMKYLAVASSVKGNDGKSRTSVNLHVQPIILKLLVTWLFDYPSAVQCFLDSRPHLTYLLELVSNPNTTVCIRGMAALLLGECVLYNKTSDAGKDAFSIVDAISQKIGLASYFLKFDDMHKSFLLSSAKSAEPRKPLTRSSAASMAEIEDVDDDESTDQRNEENPILASIFDSRFVNFIKSLEADIRESILEIYSHPKSKVAVVPAELEQMSRESDADYKMRLKAVVGKQYSEIQDLINRIATLADDSSKTGGSSGSSHSEPRVNGSSESEALHRDLQEAYEQLEMLKMEKSQTETDLKSLSDAYNSLEQANYHLEKEIKALKAGGAMPIPDVESIKAEAREESQKESEAELNDLLVCLGQEQSKVEKLSARLLELGEDVEQLLEGIGDDIDIEVPEDEEEEED